MRSRSPKKRLVVSPSFRVLAGVLLAASVTFVRDGTARAAPPTGTDVCYLGGSLLPNFQLNGNAILNGTDLIVTQSKASQLSSVMYYPRLSTNTDLHIAFQIKISANVGGGADGMAFVMHDDPAGAGALGLAGSGIGYQGITNSVVVEFDTFKNSPWDPDDNHIAITEGGDPVHTSSTNAGLPVVSNPNGVNLKSGSLVYVWIDYDHSGPALSVYVAATNTKPAMTTMSAPVNLATVIGSSSFTMGFTASTGGAWSQHEFVQMFASDHVADPSLGCCSTDSDCAASPAGNVCDTAKHLCGACTEANVGACPDAFPACDVSSSSDQCAVACNGNNGSTATQPCASPAFPACAAGGSCATCNGDYQSAGTIDCGSGAPYCAASGYCGLCTQNTDCTATNAIRHGAACNVATGACVACAKDSDCSGATYCDGTTFTCASTLANGQPIPGDPLHNATCTAPTGAAVCTSGACDTDNKCGLAMGDSTCSATAQCRTGVCVGSGANSGKCEPCVSDVSCSGGTPACNATTNQCVVCTVGNASACTGSTPVCVLASNSCVSCGGDYGSVVSVTPGIADAGADADAATDAGVDSGVDASPDASADASDGGSGIGAVALCPSISLPYCSVNGTCAKCSSNADCATSTHAGDICNVVTGECGSACTVDNDCPGGWCNNPSADAGSGSCATKVPNGGPIPASAPLNSTCTESVGSRVCASGVCDTGNNLCGEPNGQMCASAAVCTSGVCNADGKCGNPDGASCTTPSTCRTGMCNAAGTCGALVVDAGSPDGAVMEAGSTDGAVADAEARTEAGENDATVADAAEPSEAGASENDGLRLQGGGCRCETVGGAAPIDGLPAFGTVLALLGARARRRRRRDPGVGATS